MVVGAVGRVMVHVDVGNILVAWIRRYRLRLCRVGGAR